MHLRSKGLGVTAPRTDYSREESLRRLGPEVIAEIDRIVAAAPMPTPEAIQAIQTVYGQIEARRARAADVATQAA
jgi:hypothetical protein